ncbi:MAG: DUF1059 domain-containing protein [Nitrosarchaeum sp.]|nr:DUF1059 domain-containing protein [Nitrosarchaeum sp.]
MVKSFKCSDLGMKCEWSTKALNMIDLMNKISRHVDQIHDIPSLSIDMKKKIDKAVKEELIK